MNHSPLLRRVRFLLLAAVCAPLAAQAPTPVGATRGLGQLPARIVPNVGQWASPELYRLQTAGMQVFLEQHGWSFWLQEATPSSLAGAGPARGVAADQPAPAARAVAVRMEFLGAGAPEVVAERVLSGTTNFLLGEPAPRRTGVPGYGAVLYEAVYPGVDVRMRTAEGHCEYDLLLAAGADLAQVRVRVTGAQSLAIDAAGTLVMQTPLGEVRQPLPGTWMSASDGTRLTVPCVYVLHGTDCFGFAAPLRDPSLPLVVDPPLLYSTYFGGSGNESPTQVIEDGNGRILVCGQTASVNFPTTVGSVQPASSGGFDGFVFCIDPSQPPTSQVVFSTYVGGAGADAITSLATLPNGLLAFTGYSGSTNLPVTGTAYQPTNAGGDDAFLGVLDPSGSVLLGLTYFGGSASDQATSILRAPNGDLFVVGNTRSTTLPTTATGYSTTHFGGALMTDGFIARFDPLATTLLYGSFFGGSGDEWLYCWDIDAAGVLTMMSGTSSTNFPTTPGAFDPTHNGGGTGWNTSDMAIARFDPSLPPSQQLLYSTYLGGSGDDVAFCARTTPTGQIVVAGTTNSTNFPTTTGAYQPFFRGGINATNGFIGDGFMVKLDPSLSGSAGLVAATYFGGIGQDQALDCAIDSAGEVTLVGWSSATNNNLPTTPDAMRRTYALNDGYLARFSGDARQLLYASYIGGTGHDGAWLVARHADGVPTVVGATNSANLPLQNAVQPTLAGGLDAFVSRFQLIPSGTMRRGGPSLGTNGWPTIHALGDATIGNSQFGFACSRAPFNKVGFLVFSWLPAPGVSAYGINAWVDLSSIALSVLVMSNSMGESTYSLPYPSSMLPTLHVQYAWLENPSSLALSSSDALQIH